MAFNTTMIVYDPRVKPRTIIDTTCSLGSIISGCRYAVPDDIRVATVSTWLGRKLVTYYFVESLETERWYPIARLESTVRGKSRTEGWLFIRGIRRFHLDCRTTGCTDILPVRLYAGDILCEAADEYALSSIPLDDSVTHVDSVAGLSLANLEDDLATYLTMCVAASNSELADNAQEYSSIGDPGIIESARTYSAYINEKVLLECSTFTQYVSYIAAYIRQNNIKADVLTPAMNLRVPNGILTNEMMDVRFRYLLEKTRLTWDEMKCFLKLMHSPGSADELLEGAAKPFTCVNNLTGEIGKILTDYLVNDDYCAELVEEFSRRGKKCDILKEDNSTILINIEGSDALINKVLFMCASPSLLFRMED